MRSRMCFAISIIVTFVLLVTFVPDRTASTAAQVEPIAHTAEPRKVPKDRHSAKPAFLAVDEPVELQNEPFGILSAASADSAIQSSAGNWYTEYIDYFKNFYGMTDRSLRLDDEGHPHIAYGGNRLYYAWHDGIKWHYETVDDVSNVGAYAALVLDGSGQPHISYFDATNHSIKYARRDSGTWRTETIDSADSADEPWSTNTSLALDASDRPHISYYTGRFSGDLRYARYDGVEWQIETVDSKVYAPYGTSLALDASNRPHISYYGNAYLRYAWKDETDWHVETVDEIGLWGSYTSLALDMEGRPHIGYRTGDAGEGNYDLKYTRYDGMSWHIETVDKMGYWGMYISLVLSKQGEPHISYETAETAGTDSDLKYARYDRAVWHIETVNGEGDVGRHRYISLVLDASDRPHISYYDDTNDELEHAWHDGRVWQSETVDKVDGVGKYNSLALDRSNLPHVSYSRNDSLKYARHDGTVWHIETVDGGGSVGQYNSLALDELDRPRISYYDEKNQDLKYTWFDGENWYVETVDDEGDVGRYNSLALDGLGRPHISYFDDTNRDLKYARHDGKTWHVEVVDGEENAGWYTWLALDGAGRPRISYSDQTKGDLRYAFYDGVAWQVELVDSGIWVIGDCTSLALDRSGHPHISYYASSPNYALKYAHYDGTDWQIEIVDSAGMLVWPVCVSLALDRSDQPHISYQGDLGYRGSFPTTHYSLKYASLASPAKAGEHKEMNWHIEIVDDVGRFASLALDRLDLPHFSYYDFTQDLKYARQISSLNKRAMPDDQLYNKDTLTYTLTFAGPALSVHLRDPLPDNVRYVSGTLTNTVAPAAVYSPTARTVAWQGTLPTDTVQVVRFQVTANVAGRGLQPVLITNTAWLTDTQSGAVLSSTARVNVVPPPFFLRKRATPDDGVRNNETLTYTLTFSGPGLSLRLWDPLPPGVRYVSGSLTGTVTPPAIYSPTARAVVWEGTLLTDTVRTVRFQVTPGLTGTGSLSLSAPIVNTAWLTDTESGWSVSAMNFVNGWRLYLPLLVTKSPTD